uniref:Uncharacterized protein n=1 Tax=Auxenochlorella protothecoides TaxID=3075 RepID=A0A1D1ZWA0_AUXPR
MGTMLKAIKKALAPAGTKSKAPSTGSAGPPASTAAPPPHPPVPESTPSPEPVQQVAPRDLPPPEAPLSDQEANKLPDPGTEGAEAALLGSHGSNPALHHLGLDPDEKLDYSHSHTLEDGEGHDSPRPYEDGADHGAASDAEVDGQAGEHDGHAPAEEYPGLVYLCSSADPDCDDTMSVVSDAMTEEELAEELNELTRALSAMEVEGPQRAASEAMSAASEGDVEPVTKMVSLYNTLAVKLMDAKNYDNALTLLRKAEALGEDDGRWGPEEARARPRLRCITFNNLGCLFRRRNAPAEALQYLARALEQGRLGGDARSAASTHLNVCAAYAGLRRDREALGHAERAALLLQRELFVPAASSFAEGLAGLAARLAAERRHAQRTAASVLAMAYHNAALAHERLGSQAEARVALARARAVADRCLGHRSHTAASLHRAEKAFLARHQRPVPAPKGGKKPDKAAPKGRVPSVTTVKSGLHGSASKGMLKPPRTSGSKMWML